MKQSEFSMLWLFVFALVLNVTLILIEKSFVERRTSSQRNMLRYERKSTHLWFFRHCDTALKLLNIVQKLHTDTKRTQTLLLNFFRKCGIDWSLDGVGGKRSSFEMRHIPSIV